MTTDPIADFLTRIRNAIKARHRVVEIPASNLKKELTVLLYEKGYIATNYHVIEEAKEKARLEADRIKQGAQAEIDQAVARAKEELRSKVVTLACAAAPHLTMMADKW